MKNENNQTQKKTKGVGVINYKEAPKPEKEKNSKTLLIVVCIFLVLSLTFGIVFGAITLANMKDSVIEYKGTKMTAGVGRYFASYAKGQYMSSLSATTKVEDTEEFWSKSYIGTKTYGEALEEYVIGYLSQIVVGCYIYDSLATLTKAEREKIDELAEQRLMYLCDGSKSDFNKATRQYGFDFSDFKEAMTMSYKAQNAAYYLYGIGGADLKNYPDECNEFLENYYLRARLLFIRTKTDYTLDELGNRVQGANGTPELSALTDAEITERQLDIAAIKEAIKNVEEGESGQMSETAFNSYLEKYKATNMDLRPGGEYYMSASEYTARAMKSYPEIVETAFGMDVGEFEVVELDFGVCVIYRCEVAQGAYLDDAEDGPFSDFYTHLAALKYSDEVTTLAQGVEVQARFYDIDLVALPKNGIYTLGV